MVPKTEPPICAGCNFYHFRKGTHDDGRSRHQCQRDCIEPATVSRDLVTGAEIIHSAGAIRFCTIERGINMFFWLPLQSDRCGPDGKFYRAKAD